MSREETKIAHFVPAWSYDFWYWAHRRVMRTYLRGHYRVSVSGTEHVPSSGPILLAANHVTRFDPTFLMTSVPRQIHFMAKSELWDAFWPRFYVSSLRCVPVRRGASDRRAIQQALSLLAGGAVVGIFVEGERIQRGERLHYIHPGAAMLSIRSGAPILPVVLLVSGDEVAIRIGAPLRFDVGIEKKSRSARYDAFSERLAATLVELSGGRLQYTPQVKAFEVTTEEQSANQPAPS